MTIGMELLHQTKYSWKEHCIKGNVFGLQPLIALGGEYLLVEVSADLYVS